MIMGRGLVNRLLALIAALAALAGATAAQAEDGYQLWLRYAPLEGEQLAKLEAFDPHVGFVTDLFVDKTAATASDELKRGLRSLLGRPLSKSRGGGSISFSCGEDSRDSSGRFLVVSRNTRQISVSAPGSIGCLYGAFALLRELSLGADPAKIDIQERPAMPFMPASI